MCWSRAKLREIDPGLLAKFETLDEAIGRMSGGLMDPCRSRNSALTDSGRKPD